MSDTYQTLNAGATVEQSVQGSQFIAEALPVRSREEVADCIDAIREREPNATHHCFAYRLGATGKDFRYNDDGEPSGTAGRPILRQIDAHDLTNTLIVVTRYFGGTELGTGGLARAYSDAASAALAHTSVVERVIRTSVRLRYDYDDTAPAEQVLRRFDTEVHESHYTDITELTVRVRQSELDAFVDAFRNALGGRGEILRVEDEDPGGED